MIRKLQRRFILIATAVLILVTSVLITVINAVQIYRSEVKSADLLEYISAQGNGFPAEPPSDVPEPRDFAKSERRAFRSIEITPETEFITRYFSVTFSDGGTLARVKTDHIAAVTESEAEEYARSVLATGKTTGYSGNYKYLIKQSNGEQTVWFLDCSEDLQARTYLLLSTFAVGAGFVLLCVILIALLSRRMLRPIIENAERQKRFITDAGHELKTPLAIISANTDVLALNDGENEWIESTRNQLTRMEKLVQDLLTLARTEESVAPNTRDFDLSEAVSDTASPFRSLAAARGKEVILQIEPDVIFCGDEGQLRRLVSILMDNAVKYAAPSAPIRLNLKRENKRIILTQSNACDPMPDKDALSRLFDRFYRADPSRSRESGGFGIGLSIARGIVDAHRGKITAKATEDGLIVFSVTL